MKAEVDEAAWATLYSPVRHLFPMPESGRIAVKLIKHCGDDGMTVFEVKSFAA